MNTFLKKNLFTIIIVLATLILAGIAVYTAIRLYQARQTTIAPTAPESKPRAQQVGPSTQCTTSFTITVASSTPSPTPSPSASPSPTPGGSCNNSCGSSADCQTGYICSNGACRNPSCTTNTNCVCATPTPTPRPECSDGVDNDNDSKIDCTVGNSDPGCFPDGNGGGGTCNPNDDDERDATAAPSLPEAGVSFPTILGASMGIILLIGALLLAL